MVAMRILYHSNHTHKSPHIAKLMCPTTLILVPCPQDL
uniref:Uncharacterized protein n=1 Tax=Arundo donax TaxID=35708 RepID=A0A0A9AVW0_ARUDO